MKNILPSILIFLVVSCSGSDNPLIYGEWIEVERDFFNIILPDSLNQNFAWDDEIPEFAQYITFHKSGDSFTGHNKNNLFHMYYSFKKR